MDQYIYKDALENAVASVEMEGYDLNEKQKQFCLDFLNSKIDKDTFIKTILEGCMI